jgi:NurA-like 5'-3' nuclease
LGGGGMNDTKETKNKAYDLLYRHLMSNIKQYNSQADQKLYRLLLEKYSEERKENEHY